MQNNVRLNGAGTVEEIETNKMLIAALWYASRGWRVFPLTPMDKVPLKGSGGFKDATCDEAIIKNWWASNPNFNVGIATGVASGLLILDNDAYKGGQATLDALTSTNGDLPPSVEVQTGGGGSQYYYRYPMDGVKYGNKGYSKKIWPFIGLDIRGEGGYVVAPPSIHPSGKAYAFEASSTPLNTPLADAPTWLLAMIRGEGNGNSQGDAADTIEATVTTLATAPTAEVITPTASVIEVPQGQGDKERYRSHLAQRARQYLETAEPAIEGQGGDLHTFAVAGNLLSLECGGERMSVDEVAKAMMGQWNKRCSPPWDAAGLDAKVKSAASNGTARAIKRCKVCNAVAVEGWGMGTPGATGAGAVKIYSPSNLGDGQLFADTFKNEVRYVSEWKRWLRWDGRRWASAPSEIIRRYAHKLVVEIMPTVAKSITGDDERSKYYKHIAASHQTFAMDAMIKEATAYISVSAAQLDTDDMLFNLQNGTLDCRTAEVRPHRREDFISKISPCSYDAAATCPNWERFINRIMADADVISYLQKAMGYSLTGSVAEECMLVLHGNGANGKSTFLETLLHCLGDYGLAMSPTVLLSDNRQGVNSDDIAQLHGVRCAVAVETGDGGKMNMERVKAITGGDKIAACRKYESPFAFHPTHKIWLATNFMPRIDGADQATMRRLKKVPFNAKISDAEKDMTLKGREGKLALEADGILAWMIAGLKRWRVEGLQDPKAVKDATAKYGEDMDVFGQFLTDVMVKDAKASVKSSILFHAYQNWAKDNGMDYPMTAITLAKKLGERGYMKSHTSDGNVWRGIGLLGEVKGDDRPF